MGWLDRFRKPKAAKSVAPLPQLSYSVAYYILPPIVFNDLPALMDHCQKSPDESAALLYHRAAGAHGIEPQCDDASQFRWHHGQLDDDHEYFVLQFPTPPPLDLSGMSLDSILGTANAIVLAPYFSAIIRCKGDVDYFVLGQAPMDGGTTLRRVLPNGANCNLGPGPKPPELAAFLNRLRNELQSAGTTGPS